MSAGTGDGLLLDVSGIALDNLDFSDGSGLDQALARILATSDGCNFNSFSSAI